MTDVAYDQYLLFCQYSDLLSVRMGKFVSTFEQFRVDAMIEKITTACQGLENCKIINSDYPEILIGD